MLPVVPVRLEDPIDAAGGVSDQAVGRLREARRPLEGACVLPVELA